MRRASWAKIGGGLAGSRNIPQVDLRALWHTGCETTELLTPMAIADRNTVASSPRTSVRPFTRADVDAWQAWPDYEDQLLVGTSPRRMSTEQRSRWFDDITRRQRQLPYAVDDESGEM